VIIVTNLEQVVKPSVELSMTDFIHISKLLRLPAGTLTGEFWIVWKIASNIGLTSGTGEVTPNIRTSKQFALDARSSLSFTTARQVLLLLQRVCTYVP